MKKLLQIFFLFLLLTQLNFGQWIKHFIDEDIKDPSGLDIADFDGDSDLDVTATDYLANLVVWYENDGEYPFNWTEHTIDNTLGSPHLLRVGDIDGDMDLDIVTPGYGSKNVVWYENNGGNPIAWPRYTIGDGLEGAAFVNIFDIDGDTDMDVLSTGFQKNYIYWFENTGGDPIGWNRNTIDDNLPGARHTFAADIDADMDMDIAVAVDVSGAVVWYENDSENVNWTKHTIDNNLAGANNISVADIDGDMDLDVVANAIVANTIVWYENSGGIPISWSKHIIGDHIASFGLGLTDIDGDEDFDIVSAGDETNGLVWFENSGEIPITWNKHTIDSEFNGRGNIRIADADDDGDEDVFVGAPDAGVILWYENSLNYGVPWTQKADMINKRQAHSSGVLDGKIYVVGGVQYNTSVETHYNAIKGMEFYDPDTDIWDSSKAEMNTGRVLFPTCVYDGKIWAIGGGQSMYWDPLSSVEVYDPDSDTWTYVTDMPRPRIAHTAAVVDGKIYVIGGAVDNDITLVSEIDVYDPQTKTWDTTKSKMITPRMWIESVVLNEIIYVIGGHRGSENGELGVTIVEAYDPTTDMWTAKSEMNDPRKGFSMCVLDKKIYAFGGASGYCAGLLKSVEAYNPSTDTWSERTDIPNVWVLTAATSLNGKAYLSGGTTPVCPPTVQYTFREYNPYKDTTITTEIRIEHNKQQGEWFTLYQNYPNPFNPSTTIKYSLPRDERRETKNVKLMIFDLLGREVATLVNKKQKPGNYAVEFDASYLTSGIYFYSILTGEFTETKKMILIK